MVRYITGFEYNAIYGVCGACEQFNSSGSSDLISGLGIWPGLIDDPPSIRVFVLGGTHIARCSRYLRLRAIFNGASARKVAPMRNLTLECYIVSFNSRNPYITGHTDEWNYRLTKISEEKE